MSLKNTLRLLAVTTVVGAMASANAGTATGTMNVTLTVTASCQVGSSGPLAFNSGNTGANSTINVTCSKGTAYSVGLTPHSATGTTASTTGAGSMRSTNTATTNTNTDTVPYQLNSDNNTSTGKPWGNQTGTAAVTGIPAVSGNEVTGTGNGNSQALPVYGYVASTNVTPDSYADTVAIQVNF